jgi:hypothetical protein
VFPSLESYVRLTICYLVEYAKNWETERNYVREDKVLEFMELLISQSAN